VWTTGLGTAYVAGRRATHEHKRHQFQELVNELTTVYPISEGVLKGLLLTNLSKPLRTPLTTFLMPVFGDL
jgi:hypothetical protein